MPTEPIYILRFQTYEGAPRWYWAIVDGRDGHVVVKSNLFSSLSDMRDNAKLARVLFSTPGALKEDWRT